MADSTCPKREQLSGYLLGTLAEEQAEVVAGHIEACPACEATVVDLERNSDTVVTGLKQPAAVSFQSESDLRRALDQLGSLTASATTKAPSKLGELGQYRLPEKLGSGGMGAVYKAVHTHLDKLVAIKVLPADRTCPSDSPQCSTACLPKSAPPGSPRRSKSPARSRRTRRARTCDELH